MISFGSQFQEFQFVTAEKNWGSRTVYFTGPGNRVRLTPLGCLLLSHLVPCSPNLLDHILITGPLFQCRHVVISFPTNTPSSKHYVLWGSTNTVELVIITETLRTREQPGQKKWHKCGWKLGACAVITRIYIWTNGTAVTIWKTCKKESCADTRRYDHKLF